MRLIIERLVLIAALVLLWAWLARPARARWIERLREQNLTLAVGAAVLLNLILVAAIPLMNRFSPPMGELVPPVLRELATLVIAAPLMVVALRFSRHRS
jgi:hypothetical protein